MSNKDRHIASNTEIAPGKTAELYNRIDAGYYDNTPAITGNLYGEMNEVVKKYHEMVNALQSFKGMTGYQTLRASLEQNLGDGVRLLQKRYYELIEKNKNEILQLEMEFKKDVLTAAGLIDNPKADAVWKFAENNVTEDILPIYRRDFANMVIELAKVIL